MNNGLPVKRNLVQRGIRCDPLCPRCGNHIESISHTFMQCSWVQRVWFASPLTLNFQNLDPDPLEFIE